MLVFMHIRWPMAVLMVHIWKPAHWCLQIRWHQKGDGKVLDLCCLLTVNDLHPCYLPINTRKNVWSRSYSMHQALRASEKTDSEHKNTDSSTSVFINVWISAYVGIKMQDAVNRRTGVSSHSQTDAAVQDTANRENHLFRDAAMSRGSADNRSATPVFASVISLRRTICLDKYCFSCWPL